MKIDRYLGGNHCIIQGAQPGVLCDDLEGWDVWVGGGSDGEKVCILMADASFCAAGTSTAL